jgi:hypothetical protein
MRFKGIPKHRAGDQVVMPGKSLPAGVQPPPMLVGDQPPPSHPRMVGGQPPSQMAHGPQHRPYRRRPGALALRWVTWPGWVTAWVGDCLCG